MKRNRTRICFHSRLGDYSVRTAQAFYVLVAHHPIPYAHRLILTPTTPLSRTSPTPQPGLLDWCDDIDFGSDFLKMGGVEFLSRFVVSSHSGLRWRILDLMATILQNNEWAQNEASAKVTFRVFDEFDGIGLLLKAHLHIAVNDIHIGYEERIDHGWDLQTISVKMDI